MDVEVVIIFTVLLFTAIQIGNARLITCLFMNFITFVMKLYLNKRIAFCSKRSDSLFHNESLDFWKQETYVITTIYMYGKNIEKVATYKILVW